jgi:small subunit ribosomal protein S19
MSRSLRKGIYVNPRLVKKVQDAVDSGKSAVIKTWDRDSTIIPLFVGHTVAVHKGNGFTPVLITENMIGKKLGEFAPTRTFKGHGGKLAKQKGR